MSEFDDLIGPLLDREGGYSNRKADRGGPTNFGITQRVLDDWAAAHADQWGAGHKDVRSLTRDQAVGIYYDRYWKASNCEALPTRLREVHFDAAVQHGPARAVILLQQAAGATQDGVFGPATLRAVFAMNAELLFYRYLVMRYRFYGDIIERDPSQDANIDGWMRRMEKFS